MKQIARFVMKPGTFFNQLQWSRHHSTIVIAFVLVAAVETQVGTQHKPYQIYATYFAQGMGIPFSIALWILVFFKISFLATASYLLANLLWLIGNSFGKRSSRRVLVRRISIVFTVALAAYTASHLENTYTWMGTLSFFLAFWSLILGYFAIREQFVLSHIETTVVGLLTLFLVVCSWKLSNQLFETATKRTLKEITFKSPSTPSGKRPGNLRPKY